MFGLSFGPNPRGAVVSLFARKPINFGFDEACQEEANFSWIPLI
jgi:hypothetical protein